MKLNQTNLIKGIKEFYKENDRNYEIISIRLWECDSDYIKYEVNYYDPVNDSSYTTRVVVGK